MEDRLPNISIKIDTNPSEFLKRIESIASQTGDFQVRLHEDIDSERFHVLNVTPEFSTPHKELFGQLIALPELNARVRVEMRASRWNPEPPSYDAYVESARSVFAPLLQLYNKSFHSRRRLTVQSKESLRPSLPPRANKFFNEFVVLANKNGLHPYDWERFYRFIYICSPRNIKLTRDDVKRLLILSGFSIQYADYLSDIFEHGRDLLRFVRK